MTANNDLLNVAKKIDRNARTLSSKFEIVVALDDFAYMGLFKVTLFACCET